MKDFLLEQVQMVTQSNQQSHKPKGDFNIDDWLKDLYAVQ